MKKPKKAPVRGKTTATGTLAGRTRRGIASKAGSLHARGKTPAGRTRASGTLSARTPPGRTSASGSLKKPGPKKTPKKRQWSPGWDVACCSAQAVGTLLGWDWQQVLGLYWRTAAGPDEGATILDTLNACREVMPLDLSPESLSIVTGAGLILGLALPEPHAIAVTPDGRWWSWGEPFSPGDWPGLVIDEAWTVELCAG